MADHEMMVAAIDPWGRNTDCDVYCEDSPWYIVGGTRNQARAMVASVIGDDYVRLVARRVYLRPWDDEELAGSEFSEGVWVCDKDHPYARAGWEVE